MGYHLTNLYNISPDDKYSYFVFYAGHLFNDTVSKWIDRNFSIIAKVLGNNAVIVRGLTEEFDVQVLEAYQSEIETIIIKQEWDKGYNFERSLNRLLTSYIMTHNLGWENLYPLLFVTDKNPSSENSKDNKKILDLLHKCAIIGTSYARGLIEKKQFSYSY